MKKLFFTILLILSYLVAQAQWGNCATEARWINSDNEYFYEYELAQTAEGNTWFYLSSSYNTHYIQLYDSTGVATLGDSDLMLISDYPQPMSLPINQSLYVDRDGNALVVIPDLRYNTDGSDLTTFSVYKISQKGEFLWGKEGVALNKGANTYINGFLGITQMSDGSYVFTWLHSDETETIFTIDLQRVSADGKLLWDVNDTRIADPEGKIMYFWPYVVDAGNNQCILVYTKGSNYDLYARKLDFDGTAVWSEDTRIYRGGFLLIPLWTVLDVEPSGDGGVIITWYDDRYFEDTESIYMTYVKSNGELGFAAGEEGQKLSYSGYRALSTSCKYDPASDTFIALWREATHGQGGYRIVAQSVSKEGELLWGEEGLEVETFDEREYSNLQLEYGHEGEMLAFYMKSNTLEYGNIDVRMQRIDTKKGALVWSESKVLTDTLSPTHKTDLKVTTMQHCNSGAFGWDDRGITSDPDYKRLYLQRVNYDGTVGNPTDAGVEEVCQSDMRFYATSAIVNNEAIFAVEMSAVAEAVLTIYDVNGAVVATPFDGVLQAGKQYVEWRADVPAGVYVATLTTTQGVSTVKVLVK